MKTFGSMVRSEREKRDLTQVQLAAKAKVDPGTVARVERDEQRASKRVRRVLSRILGIQTERGARAA